MIWKDCTNILKEQGFTYRFQFLSDDQGKKETVKKVTVFEQKINLMLFLIYWRFLEKLFH